ncbi:hypothetical protein D9613_010263 [Agrocybe pediades]|uniref:Uncharacterized protein n=1 Tax=Agrocybe pediades TaxID=84607 RepID=A0A8H4QF30_9AGAR|nr:hypothetical protein D9613_010263 [Agrocybe pediades]
MKWSQLTSLVVAGSALSAMAASSAGPSSCVTFDVNWNLLAFGFNGKDFNAGTQDTWAAAGTPTDITTTGRPPFDMPNTTCYLAQFFNAIYVLNADSANPSSVYIYDVAKKSWSMQKVDTANSGSSKTFDPTNFKAILDHDTNVFYSYSAGEMFALDMKELVAATSAAIPWTDVQAPDLSAHTDNAQAQTPGANTDGYQPVMALAQNHIHFLGINGIDPGNAKIFVIHFSFMQPTPQFYGTKFPSTHGQAASFFLDSGVQQEFAFIPDDGSATYVINVETNTTKTLTGPPVADPFASYSASTSALVQLTTDGKVAFLPYDPKTTTSGGTWSTLAKLPAITGSGTSTSTGGNTSSSGTPGSSSSGGSSSSSGGNSSNNGGSGSGNSSSQTQNGNGDKGGAVSLRQGMWGVLLGTVVAGVGLML